MPRRFRIFWPRLLACALLLAACPRRGRADILHLTNGQRIEGEVEKTERGYKVRTRIGVVVIPAEKVVRWERKDTPAEIYAAWKRSVAPDDFLGQMALAQWCRSRNMHDQARWHGMLAVAIRPDDANARQAAGFVRHRDQWITHDEFMRRKGYRRYRDKWYPAEEATRRALDDERQERHQAVYETAWKILRRAGRFESRPLEPMADELVALGPAVVAPLDRGADDGFRRVRRLTLIALSRMSCRESLAILLRRLRIEQNTELFRLVCHALAARPDRDAVLTRVLDWTVNHEHEGVRRRTWVALAAIGDRQAIDALVPVVEYCPVVVPDNAPAGDDESTVTEGGRKVTSGGGVVEVDGKKAQRGREKPKDPYWPAHEVLVHFTGQMLERDKARWENWWTHNRADFSFRPVPDKPSERLGPAEE